MLFKIEKPDETELKQFAVGMAVALPLIFIVVLPWLFEIDYGWWSLYFSAVLLVLRLFFVKGLAPVYFIWIRFATMIGWVNTNILLSVLFFGLIWPIGFVMRRLGKLNYVEHKTTDRTHTLTYWKVREHDKSSKSLKDPF